MCHQSLFQISILSLNMETRDSSFLSIEFMLMCPIISLSLFFAFIPVNVTLGSSLSSILNNRSDGSVPSDTFDVDDRTSSSTLH